MTDSIVKLRIDSQEYDANLKKANVVLNQYFNTVRKGGGTLTQLGEGVLDAVKAIGQMETASNSAKGTLSELTKAFTDLHVQYQNFTDEEKTAPIGQEMSKSLDALSQRITETKTQLDTANTAMQGVGDTGNGTGGILDQLAGKFTLNVDALKLLELGLSATEAVLGVVKDAFFSNEQQLDEWGRITESSKSLYNGFLDALNTGDISGYLSNIDTITKAARDAYDALDELATFNAFNQVNLARARTNMTESIADYRQGQGSKEVVKASGEAYKKELQERQKLEAEAYKKEIAKLAAQRGVNARDLEKALSGRYGDYKQLKDTPLTGSRTVMYSGGMFGGGGSYQAKTAANERERLGDSLRRLNDTELQSLQALGAQAQNTGNEIAQVDKQLARVLNGRNSSGKGITVKSIRKGGGGSGTTGTTPAQQAAKSIETAEQEYARALEKSRIEVDNGRATTADAKKAEYNAMMSLWTAYSKAADAVPNNQGYKDRLAELEGNLKTLGGEVTASAEAQKQMQEQTRKAVEAWKKLEAASTALYDAQEKNDLGAFYKANRQYQAAGGPNQLSAETFQGGFTATTANVDAFIKNLQQRIGEADLGTTLYDNLTAQLADATMLGNLIDVAVKNGLQLDGFDPQEFWKRVFGDNPGDYIEDKTWEELAEKMRKELKKKGIDLAINTTTGEAKTGSGKKNPFLKQGDDGKTEVRLSDAVDGIAGSISSMANGLEQMGVEIPDGLKQGLTAIQTVTTILSVISSTLMAIEAISAADAIIPFAHGGIVGKAAGGMLIPGRSFSGDNLRMPIADGGMIGVNSGELILSKAQQDSIAGQLQGGDGWQNLRLSTELDGRMLRIVLNSDSQSRGRGKYVTSTSHFG